MTVEFLKGLHRRLFRVAPPSAAQEYAKQRRLENLADHNHYPHREVYDGQTNYDDIAKVIEKLYNTTPKIKAKVRIDDTEFRPKNPYHGFTTYQLDWEHTQLPPSVSELLHTKGPDERLNISIHDFTVPMRIDGDGETQIHILGIDSESGKVELRTRKIIYDMQDYWERNPYAVEYKLDLKYLPVGSDGNFTTQEDARNFHIENGPIPPRQLFIVKNLLKFTIEQRKRQLPKS